MKPIIRFSLALLLGLLGACAADGERSWPLCGDLEAFTVTVPGDTTRLIGIRHCLTGDTLVEPLHVTRLEADSFVICATLPNKRILAYSYRGLPIGGFSFDTFTRYYDKTGQEERYYYLGTDYKRSYHYFPRRRKLLETTHARIHCDGITVPAENGDSVRYDYQGNKVTE